MSAAVYWATRILKTFVFPFPPQKEICKTQFASDLLSLF